MGWRFCHLAYDLPLPSTAAAPLSALLAPLSALLAAPRPAESSTSSPLTSGSSHGGTSGVSSRPSARRRDCSSSSGVRTRPSPAQYAGGGQTGSSIPLPHPGRWSGLHRMRRHAVSTAACGSENCSNDCIAYSEQVGRNRQPGGSSGEMFDLYQRSMESAASRPP
eukprot:CAMPEP_0181240566 /NCGR_PEP_ID=MMETSP1096-20121128/40608_1 /TAXON_ID=156174 ORGANISM="Chrysochromulina ericina, Strain CCMP281" /NCGR_SAMPLE_ID=MMETSP1096 /ASSEMBLY_ACC=CAM_ASM_000453 /LENGTH=164 /DNA_ID=CAMNT_0023336483 /DNA_START=342 /DNA_END=832 /DNA_ORIENTATION=+